MTATSSEMLYRSLHLHLYRLRRMEEACPVDAICPDDDLPPALERFTEVNAAYFAKNPRQPTAPNLLPKRPSVPSDPLRVAIVGAGPGSWAFPARTFVAWYNGHPDHAGADVDLSGTRAVIVGNRNVALDIARVLLMTAEALQRSDIDEPALAARSASAIDEVVIVVDAASRTPPSRSASSRH